MERFTLHYQTHSPFARKALVFALEAGLSDCIDVQHQETSPTLRNETVFAINPLGKVPVLARPGLEPLYDSAVICAFLDTLHDGPPLIPATGEARWKALRTEALAAGMAESGIAVRWETVRRPEELRYAPLRDGHLEKLSAGYVQAELAVRDVLDGANPDIGQIALATTLSWLEFRGLASFRDSHPDLGTWVNKFSLRASMLATPLTGDTIDH